MITCKPQIAGQPYQSVFKPGDIVVSKINVNFTDGTKHRVGQKITILADSVSYYNVHWEHYSKV